MRRQERPHRSRQCHAPDRKADKRRLVGGDVYYALCERRRGLSVALCLRPLDGFLVVGRIWLGGGDLEEARASTSA